MGLTPKREPEKRLPHQRKAAAAGAQITQSQNEEVVTKNNETVLYDVRYRNEYNSIKPFTNSIKPFNEDLREGKSGASSRGNSSSQSVVVAVNKLIVGSASTNAPTVALK